MSREDRVSRRVTAAMLIGLAPAVALAADHITAFTGTWQYNPAKSAFQPGPPFKSFTITFTREGVRNLDLVDGGGRVVKVSLPWSDGKEVTPEGMENARVVSRIQGNTVEDTWRQNGRIIETVRGVVSADGKTLTMHVEGPLPQGGTFRNRVVFDRQ